MSTQPTQTSDDAPIGQAQTTGNEKEWKILAQEAAQEEDPEKLMEIVKALTRVLDQDEGRNQCKTGAGNVRGRLETRCLATSPADIL